MRIELCGLVQTEVICLSEDNIKEIIETNKTRVGEWTIKRTWQSGIEFIKPGLYIYLSSHQVLNHPELCSLF